MDEATLQDALTNADKTGDTEGARKLADALYAMQNSAAPAPQAAQPTAPQAKQPTPIGNNSRRIGALIRSIGQGSTFNAMDEIQAGLGALPAYAANQLQGKGGSVGDAYNQILAQEQAKLAQDKIDYPVQDFAGQLGGGLLTGKTWINAGKYVLPKVATALAVANPIKAAALTGGLTSGLYGIGGAEGGIGNRFAEGAKAVPAGLLLGTGGGVVSNSLAKSAANKLTGGVKLPVPTAEGYRAAGSKLYKAADKMGGKISAAYTKKILDAVDEALTPKDMADAYLRDNIPIIPKLDALRKSMSKEAEKVAEKAARGSAANVKANERASKLSAAYLGTRPIETLTPAATPKGKKLDGEATFSMLKSIETSLGNAAYKNHSNPATGILDDTGHLLNSAKKSVRELIDNIPESEILGGSGKKAFELKRQADKLWAQHYKLRTLENVKTRAELSDQPSTALKSGLKTILASPTKSAKFTKEELVAMKKTADLGWGVGALRGLGSRLPSSIGGGFSGASLFSPAAVPIILSTAAYYGLSAASRAAANKLQFAKADKLARLLGGQSMIAKPTRLPIDAGVYSGILANSLQNR